ncbi:phosphoribosylglycinamide formyltransferase [Clavulina sp. PMI_390]|nr:phosphoribosylglycinamide formyltransferase [Clavulina sp. PMI_390]
MVKNIVVLISGSGSNLQALIDACTSSKIPNARIIRVFSNRKAAYGLTRASSASPPIPTDILALQPYLKANPGKSREDYDVEVARRILSATAERNERIDIAVLAGWMHVLSEAFLDVLSGQTPYDGEHKVESSIPILNLHPALPGAFDGANAIPRALEAFQKGEVKHTGVMVHKVIKEVDRGEPVLVREVEILPEDDLAALETRIHAVEHEIIVEAVAKILAESS